MEKLTWEALNGIYEPLYQRGKLLLKHLGSQGFQGKLGFFNLHEKKENHHFHTEFFPLPEISIDDLGDFGINLDATIWWESTMAKENALMMDFTLLCQKYQLEIYGVQDYLVDYFDEDMKIDNIRGKLAASKETKIHLCLTFQTVEEIDLATILKDLKKKKSG